ncbi:hypothetical protein KUTeg_007225 [Tegillarca granosa]|uniref:Arginine kinase n=1 Tax=Tegillarca granosa TaxID=220873 RepID=A0ABQ9FHB0_TEGGR|nr:hypothetical protein KUTeg_007225 [Tegillarca granosa]
MDGLYKKLKEAKEGCHSLLKKYLTQEVYDELKDKKTGLGGTLLDCIRSGCENLDSHCGVYACDPEGYTVFAKLLDPVIKDYHQVKEINHPSPDFGDLKNLGFGNLDPSGEMIISTRVRVGRSHSGYLFCPSVTGEQRKEMEEKTVNALKKLGGDLAGKYYSLESMTKDEEKQLVEDHFLFKNDDRMLGSAGGYRDWPAGRGIYHNSDKTFLVWLNEEDHLRFISMQKGGDLAQVYTRLVTVSIHGENTESVGGVYDISNKRRLGLTEFEAITEMKNGILEIMKREKEL